VEINDPWTIRRPERLFRPDGHYRIHPGGDECGNYTSQYACKQADANGQQDNIQRYKDLKGQHGGKYQGENEYSQ